MSYYFKETEGEKVLLSEYVQKKHDKQREIQIKHIMSIIGDEKVDKDLITVLCESFDSSKHRYGTKCISADSIKGIYEISKLFPELSKSALEEITKGYIKDLYDEFDLITVLAMMLRTYGVSDETFERFLLYVHEKAGVLERRYQEVARSFAFYYGYQYSYDFVTHFQEFIVKHHIDEQKLYSSLPDSELVRQDEMALRKLSLRSRECWISCEPISYQLYEDYLDGDESLEKYDDTFSYQVSLHGISEPVTFTKAEFLKGISERKLMRS